MSGNKPDKWAFVGRGEGSRDVWSVSGATVVTPPGWLEARDKKGAVEWGWGVDQQELRQQVSRRVDEYEHYTRDLFYNRDPFHVNVEHAKRVANDVRTETTLSVVYKYHGEPTAEDYAEPKSMAAHTWSSTSPHLYK